MPASPGCHPNLYGDATLRITLRDRGNVRRVAQVALTSTVLVLTLQPALVRAGTVGGEVHSHLEHLVYVAEAGEINDVTITGSKHLTLFGRLVNAPVA